MLDQREGLFTPSEKRFLSINTFLLIDSALMDSSAVCEMLQEFHSNELYNFQESTSPSNNLIRIKLRNKINFDSENHEILDLISKHSRIIDLSGFENYLSIAILRPETFDFSVENCYKSLINMVDSAVEKDQKIFLILEKIVSRVDAFHSDLFSENRKKNIISEDLNNILFKLIFERNVDYEYSESSFDSINIIYNILHVLLKNKYKIMNKGFSYEGVRIKNNAKSRILGISADQKIAFVF